VLNVLQITFPFFALVLCGYVAARKGILPHAAIPGLNSFVLFFALPCIAQLLDASVFSIYLFCALVMVAFTIAVTKNKRFGWNDASLGALVAAFPNTGFMGVPLLVALLGAKAAGTAIITIVIDMVITSSLCIALSRLDGADKHGFSKAAKTALKGMLSNPMPWSILLGTLASAISLTLPKPVAVTLGLLADAASPVALFTIGAVLARSQMNSHELHEQMAWTDYVPVAVIKLFVHPILVLLVALSAKQLGAPIDTFTLTVLILIATLPSASNVSLLAERFGANNGRIARIILISTALAFLTFSGAVALLRP
jgi:malonate transporter and related proteins